MRGAEGETCRNPSPLIPILPRTRRGSNSWSNRNSCGILNSSGTTVQKNSINNHWWYLEQVHQCFLFYMYVYFNNIRKKKNLRPHTQIHIHSCVCVCMWTLYFYTGQAEPELISFYVRKFGEGESHVFLVSCCSLLHWQHSAVGLQQDPPPHHSSPNPLLN